MKEKNNKQVLKQKIIKKKSGVFHKIFAYTMLLVILICAAAVFIFSREFLSFYRAEHRRQLTTTFQPMITAIASGADSREDIIEMASRFADNNQSFRFILKQGEKDILFSTHDSVETPSDNLFDGVNIRFSGIFRDIDGRQSSQYTLTGYSFDSGNTDYTNLIKRIMFAVFLMLVIAVFGAVLFAKAVTKPLEDEIVRRKIMEENQMLFFSAASHELKTPIASARALVEGMIAGVGDYTDHPKYLRECLNALDSQGRLVSEILDIVKLSDKGDFASGGETELSFEDINLRELGNSVLGDYRPLAEKKGLYIPGEFPDVLIHADRRLLKKALSNIIANAVQNSAEGESIIIKYVIDKMPRLRIINTGAKIPDDVLPRIFEPFYRQDTARTYSITSGHNGLGLAIVKKALDRMKFQFGLDNTEEGVLFWIEFPPAANKK